MFHCFPFMQMYIPVLEEKHAVKHRRRKTQLQIRNGVLLIMTKMQEESRFVQFDMIFTKASAESLHESCFNVLLQYYIDRIKFKNSANNCRFLPTGFLHIHFETEAISQQIETDNTGKNTNVCLLSG